MPSTDLFASSPLPLQVCSQGSVKEATTEPESLTGKLKTSFDSINRALDAKDFRDVDKFLTNDPTEAMKPFLMRIGKVSSSVLHQLIAIRGSEKLRVALIAKILDKTPEAARIVNSQNCLPLHQILQRNVQMNKNDKNRITRKLIAVYPESAKVPGGKLNRLPLHVLFTDFKCPTLTQEIIDAYPEACGITDLSGYLPAHIGCRRNTSPHKLDMLLARYPQALEALTNNKESLLDLARISASTKHPNRSLIQHLIHLRSPDENVVAKAIKKPQPPKKRRREEEESASVLLQLASSNLPKKMKMETPEDVLSWSSYYCDALEQLGEVDAV